MDLPRRAVALVTIVLAGLACSSKPKGPARISGAPLMQSLAVEIYASPDGAFAATLGSPEPTRELGAPQDIKLGSLWLSPADGGAPARRLGGEVSNLTGSVLFAPDSSAIAFLAGYSVRQGAGELRFARCAGGDVETLGDGVTFYTISPASEWIAWVSQGTLFLRKLTGGEPVRVTDGVSMIEFGPRDTPYVGKMLIKRGARSGGALLMDDLATGKLSAIARGVGGFGFAPTGDGFVFQAAALLPATATDKPVDAASSHGVGADAPGLYRVQGKEAPKRVTEDTVTDFKLAPHGKRLVYLTVPSAGTAGDLFVTEGGAPERVATRVSDVQFAPDGTIVLLGNISRGSSAGTMGLVPPGGTLLQVAQNVRQFSITPKGGYLLYSQEVFHNGAFSLGFAIHKLGAPVPTKTEVVDEGVYGYIANEDETKVAYKAHCTDAGKSCGLFVADLGNPVAPVQIASKVGAFEFAPNGLVVVSSRPDAVILGRTLFSVGIMRPELRAPILTLDDQMTGQFVVAGKDHKRIVYLVGERGREGLYQAMLNEPPPPLPAPPPTKP